MPLTFIPHRIYFRHPFSTLNPDPGGLVMPTYEYDCQSCGHELEVFHSMKADPLTDCPACGKSALKRRIGLGAGLLFKGSGFYQTDYRSDSYRKAEKADSTSPAPAKESASAPKTETKKTATAESGG
jgi:putative FmdB family regulatory protein